MRRALIGIIIIIGFAAWFLFINQKGAPGTEEDFATNMLLISPSFEHNGFIPAKFTCDGSTPSNRAQDKSLVAGGGDINPELQIQNVPEGAKSLALIMDDPDAPGRIFTHWLVWNIDPRTTVIKQESRPPGSMEGKTDFGYIGYGGPCPPSGTHRYFFKLYALDAMLNLPEGTGKEGLEREIQKHLLDQAELIGLYARQ